MHSLVKGSVCPTPPGHVTPVSAPASPALSTVQLVRVPHVRKPGRPILRATDPIPPSPRAIPGSLPQHLGVYRRGSKETSRSFFVAISSKDLRRCGSCALETAAEAVRKELTRRKHVSKGTAGPRCDPATVWSRPGTLGSQGKKRSQPIRRRRGRCSKTSTQ